MTQIYEQPAAGGSWEHRSGDCAHHGANVVFARPYKSAERYQCVQCMLAIALVMKLKEEDQNGVGGSQG